MFFGPLPTIQAEGAILAHSIRLPDGVFKKGRVLAAADIQALLAGGQNEIFVAQLEDGDVGEDVAAERIARAVAGPGTSLTLARTGRCNLKATQAGLIYLDPAQIDAVNLIDEAITIATVAPFTRVNQGQVIATVKIIPLAASDAAIRAAEAAAGQGLSVHPFRPLKVALIQTVSSDDTSLLDKLSTVTAQRMARLGGSILGERRCAHAIVALAEAIGDIDALGPNLILIAGITAVMDRRDVLPVGIERAGGQVRHLGMPVDPGNLLLVAERNGIPVIGLPGCARSPAMNGFDWVLERLSAGLPVGRLQIARMGVGGLLKDVADRPLPRKQATRDA
jgi:molybdenum cofactor cytidylyltransferase